MLNMGNSDELEVAQWVLAVGSPFGLPGTVTSGIVSAKGRSRVGIADYENFIQTDAAINPGNSGGPLLNLKKDTRGVLIGDVVPESSAAVAGLNSGDVIVQIDSQPVKQLGAFRNRIASLSPKSVIQLEVLRDGDRHSMNVTIGIQTICVEVTSDAFEQNDHTRGDWTACRSRCIRRRTR